MAEERDDDPCVEAPPEGETAVAQSEFEQVGIVLSLIEEEQNTQFIDTGIDSDALTAISEGEQSELEEREQSGLSIIPPDEDVNKSAPNILGDSEAQVPIKERVPDSLEDDISFTPVENLLSGQKSTWLLSDSTLAGEGTYVSANAQTFFSLRRFQLKARSGLTRRIQDGFHCPISIPLDVKRDISVRGRGSEVDVLDPVRWVSEKNWINTSHRDGYSLRQGNQSNDIRILKKHDGVKDPRSDDVYFQNHYKPGSFESQQVKDYIRETHNIDISIGNSNPVWGIFYQDPQKSCYFIDFPGFYPRSWQGIDSFRETVTNNLRFDIRYESYALSGKVEDRQNFWNWKDYMGGDVNLDALRIMSTTLRPDQLPDPNTPRDECNNSQSPFYWNTIYTMLTQIHNTYSTTALDNRGLPSMNPVPVIPKYEVIPSSTIVGIEGITVVDGQTFGVTFYDLNTKVPELLTKDEVDMLNVGNDAYFELRPVYSYYDCLYEDIFSKHMEELELPTPYLKTELDSDIRNQNVVVPFDRDPNNFISRENYVREKLKAAVSYMEQKSDFETSLILDPSDPRGFRMFSQQFDPTEVRNFARYMKSAKFYDFNFGLTPTQFYNLSSLSREELDDKYEERYMYPMFVEMEFGKIEKSQFAEAMTYQGDDDLIRHLFKTLTEQQSSDSSGETYSYVQVRGQEEFDEETRRYLSEARFDEDSADTIPLDSNLSLDFDEWWSSAYNMFYGNQDDVSVSPIQRFANLIRMETIRARVKRVVDSSTRTYKDFMSGVPAKSEILGFVVQKFLGDQNLCNFFIMSNNDREVEKFVDTQVKYGEIYEYRIHRVVVVFGNKYAYFENQSPNRQQHLADQAYRPVERAGSTGASAKTSEGRGNVEQQYDARTYDAGNKEGAFATFPFGIANVPCVKIMLLPSERKRVCVVDKPPIFPNIEFIPYRNNQTELAIAMTSNTGEFSAPPVILEEDDNYQFLITGLSQGIPELVNAVPDSAAEFLQGQVGSELTEKIRMIKFRSDDPATKFEIFRLDHYPKSYSDFSDARITKVSNDTDGYLFKDKLMPNKKYYYIFRVEDIHGHVSNPTYVYEVALRTYDESVRLETKIVDPKDIESLKKMLRQSTTNLRQFLHIRPNIRHRIFNKVESGRVSDPSGQNNGFENLETNEMMGVDLEDSVWNKQFILRVRSINTGKEVDVKFKFIPKLNVEDNKKENLIC